MSGFVPECDDDEGGGHDRGDGGGARGQGVGKVGLGGWLGE